MGINDVIAQEVLLTCTIAQEVLYIYYLSVRPLVLSNTLSWVLLIWCGDLPTKGLRIFLQVLWPPHR